MYDVLYPAINLHDGIYDRAVIKLYYTIFYNKLYQSDCEICEYIKAKQI